MLDREKVKWLINRRSELSFRDERAIEYGLEIEDILSENMYQTMAFLEECTDEELDWLSEEIHELCLTFQEGSGEGEFIDFLNTLAESCPACKSFSGDLKLTIEALKEFDNE